MARRFSKIGNMGSVIVDGAGMIPFSPGYRLTRAICEDGKGNILILPALLIAEYSGAFPEDLLDRGGSCLLTPAWVSANDALDKRLRRRCRCT